MLILNILEKCVMILKNQVIHKRQILLPITIERLVLRGVWWIFKCVNTLYNSSIQLASYDCEMSFECICFEDWPLNVWCEKGCTGLNVCLCCWFVTPFFNHWISISTRNLCYPVDIYAMQRGILGAMVYIIVISKDTE